MISLFRWFTDFSNKLTENFFRSLPFRFEHLDSFLGCVKPKSCCQTKSPTKQNTHSERLEFITNTWSQDLRTWTWSHTQSDKQEISLYLFKSTNQLGTNHLCRPPFPLKAISLPARLGGYRDRFERLGPISSRRIENPETSAGIRRWVLGGVRLWE